MEIIRSAEAHHPREQYVYTLETVRDRYGEAGLKPLFVGGVIAKAINPRSVAGMQFDFANRRVCVPVKPEKYTAPRSDGTYDDFDIIVNHSDERHVNGTIEETAELLKILGYTRHFVSPEAVLYPHWERQRHKGRQLVSGMNVDAQGTHFNFGEYVSPAIDPATLKPWDYVMVDENGKEVVTLPSFSPLFFGLRYVMRLPVNGHGGLRGKDAAPKRDEETGEVTTKLGLLMKMRARARQAAEEQGVGYDNETWDEQNRAWYDFILHLQHPSQQDKLTRLKGNALRFWWYDLGSLATALVHGQGLIGKVTEKTGNKFGG